MSATLSMARYGAVGRPALLIQLFSAMRSWAMATQSPDGDTRVVFASARIASALTFSNSVVTAAQLAAKVCSAAASLNGAHRCTSAKSAAGALASGSSTVTR